MIMPEFSVSIRNVLLIQLLIVLLAPDYALQLRQELQKLWKTLNTPWIPLRRAARSKFWEIDMTKFEP